jgi:hypothetical protein
MRETATGRGRGIAIAVCALSGVVMLVLRIEVCGEVGWRSSMSSLASSAADPPTSSLMKMKVGFSFLLSSSHLSYFKLT